MLVSFAIRNKPDEDVPVLQYPHVYSTHRFKNKLQLVLCIFIDEAESESLWNNSMQLRQLLIICIYSIGLQELTKQGDLLRDPINVNDGPERTPHTQAAVEEDGLSLVDGVEDTAMPVSPEG